MVRRLPGNFKFSTRHGKGKIFSADEKVLFDGIFEEGNLMAKGRISFRRFPGIWRWVYQRRENGAWIGFWNGWQQTFRWKFYQRKSRGWGNRIPRKWRHSFQRSFLKINVMVWEVSTDLMKPSSSKETSTRESHKALGRNFVTMGQRFMTEISWKAKDKDGNCFRCVESWSLKESSLPT